MKAFWTPEDQARLRPRNRQVLEAMRDKGWITLYKVAEVVGLRNASTVASRLRDIKAETPFNYEIRSTDVKGLNEYRLFIPEHLDTPVQGDLFGDAKS